MSYFLVSSLHRRMLMLGIKYVRVVETRMNVAAGQCRKSVVTRSSVIVQNVS